MATKHGLTIAELKKIGIVRRIQAAWRSKLRSIKMSYKYSVLLQSIYRRNVA